MCPGGDAGSCVEAGCPEYGIFHSAGMAERHGITTVRQISSLVFYHFVFNTYCIFDLFSLSCLFQKYH